MNFDIHWNSNKNVSRPKFTAPHVFQFVELVFSVVSAIDDSKTLLLQAILTYCALALLNEKSYIVSNIYEHSLAIRCFEWC